MDAGAFGFSSTILNQHLGFGGRPARLPQREPRRAEGLRQRAAGAGQGRDRDRAHAPDRRAGGRRAGAARPAAAARATRPVTFIAMFDRDDIPEAVRETLRKAAPMIARGARPQTSPLPLTREINMRNPFSFAGFPSWKRVFEDKSKAAQAAVYRDPGVPQPVPRGAEAAGRLRQLGAHHGARGEIPSAEAPRRTDGRRDRRRAGQGRRRRLPRPHARRRPGERVHHGVVQHARRPHGGAVERSVACCSGWATAARTSTCCATRAIPPTCSAPGCASARC